MMIKRIVCGAITAILVSGTFLAYVFEDAGERNIPFVWWFVVMLFSAVVCDLTIIQRRL